MEFVASLTLDAGYIQKIKRLWQESGDTRNPLQSVLVSPLFSPPTLLKLLRNMRENGEIEQIYFDSGAYVVQKGHISYEEMYWQLLHFYKEHKWADWYVLPDYVPLSSDDTNETWRKVRVTADMSNLFYSEISSDLREKALPVIQGRTIEQAEYCLQSYLDMEVKRVGFGSFGTNGKENSVNILSPNSLQLLTYLTNFLNEKNISLHTFGVGTPPVIFLLSQANITSFDSVGWMKTAGFGKIYMPFVRAYNITYRDMTARGLTQHKFHELKAITKHDCYFCQSFETLTQSRDYRFMHNLTVVLDTIDLLQQTNTSDIKYLLDVYSPYYANLYSRMVV